MSMQAFSDFGRAIEERLGAIYRAVEGMTIGGMFGTVGLWVLGLVFLGVVEWVMDKGNGSEYDNEAERRGARTVRGREDRKRLSGERKVRFSGIGNKVLGSMENGRDKEDSGDELKDTCTVQ